MKKKLLNYHALNDIRKNRKAYRTALFISILARECNLSCSYMATIAISSLDPLKNILRIDIGVIDGLGCM